MRLVALVLEDKSIARFLRTLGEPTSLPLGRVLRRASGDDAAA